MAGESEEEARAAAQDGTLAWPESVPAASYASVKKMLELGAASEGVARHVESVFGLANCHHDARQAVLRDFYTDVVWFAGVNELTNQHASALLHVAAALLANVAESDMPAADNAAAFAAMLEGHASDKSATDADGKAYDFPPSCKAKVEEFVVSGLFKHYGMYQFLFHGDRPVNRTVLEMPIVAPPVPPPLDEAVSNEDWLANHPEERPAISSDEGGAGVETPADA